MKNTDIERWTKLAITEALPSWYERNHVIRDIIGTVDSVLDLGCGNRYLQKLLNDSVMYTGVDCVSGNGETVVINFNQPTDSHTLQKCDYDMAVISGVLEYLKRPLGILDFAKRHAKRVTVSYVCAEDRPKQPDEIHGWVNRLNENEILDMFSTAGFLVSQRTKYNRHSIFVLDKA